MFKKVHEKPGGGDVNGKTRESWCNDLWINQALQCISVKCV